MYIFLRFPEGKPKAFTLSYDDGVEQDRQLLALMESHKVKGTFNLNTGCFANEGTVYPAGTIHRRMTEADCLALGRSEYVELACHGLEHPSTATLPKLNMTRDILLDRENLEKLTGKLIRGYAYPNGSFSDETVEVLRSLGFAYARTTVSTGRFDLPEEPLLLPATCHHTDPKMMDYAEEFLSKNPDKIPGAGKYPMLFYVWGHSYEFEADGNWSVMEELLDKVSGQPDVWYSTNIEIVEYIEAYRALRFSADGSLCHNPTATDVWVCDLNAKITKVPAGRTVGM